MVVRAKSRRYIAVGWHIVVLTFYVLIQAGAGTGAWIAPGMIYIYKPGTKYEEYIDYTPALDAIVAWILGFIALVTVSNKRQAAGPLTTKQHWLTSSDPLRGNLHQRPPRQRRLEEAICAILDVSRGRCAF